MRELLCQADWQGAALLNVCPSRDPKLQINSAVDVTNTFSGWNVLAA